MTKPRPFCLRSLGLLFACAIFLGYLYQRILLLVGQYEHVLHLQCAPPSTFLSWNPATADISLHASALRFPRGLDRFSLGLCLIIR